MTRPAALALVLALACGAGRAGAGERPAPSPPVRVIVVLADGAGIGHWSAARAVGDSLAIFSFPVVGLIDTRNTSRIEPESASGASALATGHRTHYSGIGVGADSLARENVVEAAEEAGLATGVVTTAIVTDATPAGFVGHAVSRYDQPGLARQIAEAGLEVLLGDPGRMFSDDDTLGLRPTLGDVRFVDTPAGLAAATADPPARLFGFFDIDKGRDPAQRSPTLADMAAAALAVLDRDPDGFFLLVESEHTDHQSHENAELGLIAAEIRAVDQAVRVALAYRERHPDTLILVLSDHETGGLSIPVEDENRYVAKYSTTRHTMELVPLFAIGPGSERFAGVHRNDEIGRILLEIVGAP